MLGLGVGVVVLGGIAGTAWYYVTGNSSTPSKLFEVPLEEIKEDYLEGNVPTVLVDCFHMLRLNGLFYYCII